MMKIVFGLRVRQDLRWFRAYHEAAFREGLDAAIGKYSKILETVPSTPGLGRPVPDRNAREYAIPRPPFSLLYRVHETEIEILRLWNQRADRSGLWEAPEKAPRKL